MTQLTLNNESYNQFLKFKLTQQDSYSKMQQLFRYVDDLSAQKLAKFDERYENLKKMYHQAFDTQRQKKIVELINNIEKVQLDFTSSFAKYISELSKIQQIFDSGCLSGLITVNNQLSKIKKQLSKIAISPQPSQKSLYENNTIHTNPTPNLFLTELNSKITKISKILLQFQQTYFKDQQKITKIILKGQQGLRQKFEAWKSCTDQKNFMTEVCINDFLRLPEMSMVVFGTKNQKCSNEEIQMMKKIGIHLNEVSEFEYFYECQEKEKAADNAFKQMVNVKCLNCTYFKSKMRFIQKTNLQLQPVLKILNHLSRNQIKTLS